MSTFPEGAQKSSSRGRLSGQAWAFVRRLRTNPQAAARRRIEEIDLKTATGFLAEQEVRKRLNYIATAQALQERIDNLPKTRAAVDANARSPDTH